MQNDTAGNLNSDTASCKRLFKLPHAICQRLVHNLWKTGFLWGCLTCRGGSARVAFFDGPSPMCLRSTPSGCTSWLCFFPKRKLQVWKVQSCLLRQLSLIGVESQPNRLQSRRRTSFQCTICRASSTYEDQNGRMALCTITDRQAAAGENGVVFHIGQQQAQ